MVGFASPVMGANLPGMRTNTQTETVHDLVHLPHPPLSVSGQVIGWPYTFCGLDILKALVTTDPVGITCPRCKELTKRIFRIVTNEDEVIKH